jgi:alpha-1,3-glucosyltransferase
MVKVPKSSKGWDKNLIYVITIAIVLRVSTFFIKESDDMLIQRGWMRITLNLPFKEWYRAKSAYPEYWEVDYPPFSSWHQYLCGFIGSLIDPASMMLESDQHTRSNAERVYMRFTVLITDLIVTIPSLIFMFNLLFSNIDTRIKNWALLSILISSQAILIDYVNFQYNIFTINLVVIATAYSLKHRFCMSAVFFGLAVNYKVYALYFSLPFPVYWALCTVEKAKKESKVYFYLQVVWELAKICISGIVTCIIIWIPWLSIQEFSNVINQTILFKRNYIEGKVGNFWYVISGVYKIHEHFSNASIALICMVFTLLACLPFLYYLYKNHSQLAFINSICGCCLSFFLFSYMVHSKCVLYITTFANFILVIDYPDLFQVLTIVGTFEWYYEQFRVFYVIYLTIYFFVSSYYVYVVRKTHIKMHNIIVFTAIIFIHFLEIFQPKDKYLNLHNRIMSIYNLGYFCFFYYWLLRNQISITRAAEKKNE